MNVNSIDNSNFGARFTAPAFFTPPLNPRQVTINTLAKIKEISLKNGLPPKVYEKSIRKAHEIFPGNDYLISLQTISDTKDRFLVGVTKGIEYDSEIFGIPAKPKYLVGEFIGTLRKIAEQMAGK